MGEDFDPEETYSVWNWGELISIRPFYREYLLAGVTAVVCILFAGFTWGLAVAGLLFLLILGGYGALAYERSKQINRLSSNLMRTNRELEFEVEERSQAEEMLREYAKSLERARKRAEAASKAKIEFLAKMSHEIRTPMNGLIDVAQLLIDSELSQDQRDYAKTIRASAEGLLLIINDILDISKIEAGHVELEEKDFSFRHAVQNVVELTFPKAHQKGLVFTYIVDPAIPVKIKGDAMRLRQVLTNLLSNAIKFTDRGSVTLEIKLVEKSEREVVIRFQVQDTGIGVPEDQKERLFEPFTQLDPAAAREEGGGGLGLALTRELVHMMNGQIGVDSDLGAGSNFWFTVRLSLADEPGEVDSSEMKLAHKRILVIDDSPETRAVVRTYATAFEMEIFEAADSYEGMAILRNSYEIGRPIDIALIDVLLPNKDGRELATEIKSDRKLQPTSLVLLNVMGTNAKPNQLVKCGFDAWITKPVSAMKLRSSLLHVVDQAKEDPWLRNFQGLRQNGDHLELTLERPDVLLVEDNIVNQKVASLLLRKAGCEVDVAANGEIACELARKNAYDLIFMDCQMPVLDGIEATRRLRSMSESPCTDTPIIALAMDAMEDKRKVCLEAGMSDFLVKPVQYKELQAMIHKWGTTPADEFSSEANELKNLLDPEVIAGLRELGGEDDPELFGELIQIFLEDAPQRIGDLNEAVQSGDMEALERAAHTMKSSAANLGAMSLSTLFRQIEAAGKSRDLQSARPLVERADAEFVKVRKALEAELT